MSIRCILLNLTLLLCPAWLRAQTGAYEAFYDSVAAIKPDHAHVGTIQNAVLTRDAARLTLKNGTLELLTTIGGRVVGAVFHGEGSLDFVPPTDVEKEQLRRFTTKTELHEPIVRALILATDSTIAELTAKATLAAGADAPEAGGTVREALDYLKYDDARAFDPDLMRTMLDGGDRPVFYAQVVGADTYMVSLDGYDREGVQLYRPAPSRPRREVQPRHKERELICQFTAAGEAAGSRPLTDRAFDPVIRHYQGEVWLPRDVIGNISFSAAFSMAITASVPTGPWVALSLFDALVVDSARTASGKPLAAFKAKDSDNAWLRLDQPLVPGRVDTIRVYYHGDLIDRHGDWFFVKDLHNWYPRTMDDAQMATFDICTTGIREPWTTRRWRPSTSRSIIRPSTPC